MKKVLISTLVLFFVTSFVSFVHAQAPRGYALEVTYFKGRPFAYQRIGQWSWYALFGHVPGWKTPSGDVPVEAVKITGRAEEGAVKVRVTVLKGRFLETEQAVGDYPIAEGGKLVVDDLTKFGVVPFEVSLVRAAATVANLPMVVNQTRSLTVTVEPNVSSLPTFNLKLQNDSAKAVRAFSYETTVDGRERLVGMPNKPGGAILMEPSATFTQELRFPLNATTTSTGEAPAAVPELTITISSVVFADGTYEGDPIKAARFRAQNVGEKIQLQRVVGLLTSFSPEGSPDALNAQVSDLTWYLDEPAFERFAMGLPGINEKVKNDLHDYAEVACAGVQTKFVEEYSQKRNATKDNAAEFQAWIKTATEKYKKWLNSLPLQ